MSTKKYADLLIVSFMLCVVTFALLGGAPFANSSQAAYGYGHNGLGSSSPLPQHDIGPIDQNISLVNTQAIRVVSIGDCGLVTVNDTVTVRNNGSITAFYWTFYFPPDAYTNLTYVAAYGNGTSLNVVAVPPFESFVGMRADLTDIGGLAVNSSIRMTLIQQYSGLVKPYPTPGTQRALLYFYRFLVSPYLTMKYNVSVRLPTSATPSNELTEMYASIVAPFNCTRLGSASGGSYNFVLAGGQSLVEVSVDRVLEIRADGYISVTETHRVRNIGPQPFGTISFTLPLTVIGGSLEARDSSGQLDLLSQGRIVTVALRYYLSVNNSFTYYVSYRTYIDDYRTFENGLYVIRMSPVTVYNSSVSSETTSVIFPYRDQVYSASNSPSEVGVKGDNMIVTYVFHNVTPLNAGSVELRYSEDASLAFLRPLVISLGVLVIGFAYVAARKFFRKTGPTSTVTVTGVKERGLSPIIKTFCSNYEEKTALTLEMEKLAEDRRKGRVSKRAYIERVQLGGRRIASLTNSINEDKKKLIPASKRFAAIIRQLDTYEEERENARAALENLELRRRQGKVSGDVYNSLKYENTKKIDKATAGIDSLIVQFRQEA
ncbi:MAG: hypothetical protein WED04_01275 [Promethearchaeati archaeon SRVP18_Atabeyarchaeia-1]